MDGVPVNFGSVARIEKGGCAKKTDRAAWIRFRKIPNKNGVTRFRKGLFLV